MEENDETEINGKAVVEDLKLLIESITYQQEDLEFQEQALKTMASIFHTSGKQQQSKPANLVMSCKYFRVYRIWKLSIQSETMNIVNDFA